MIENNPTSVVAAFEMLLEEIEAEIDFVNRMGAKAFEDRDYDKAKEALERAAQVSGFRDKADDLRQEWETLFSSDADEVGTEAHSERRNLGRLRRGLRTREEAYYQPILNAILQLGGSAQMSDVLEQVHAAMKNTLQDVDFDPLASDPDMPRWRNAAQWARNSMVKKGLMKSNSRRGIWEISDKGRQWLAGVGS
ncbi:MAG: winged helix-turn-helix domain-containing protein [Candidatus Hydrogenedentales bacterium]